LGTMSVLSVGEGILSCVLICFLSKKKKRSFAFCFCGFQRFRLCMS